MSAVQLVLVVFGAIVVTGFARRRDLQPALVITVVGLAASFIPGVPRLELESDVVLSVLLPPLLYSAALDFSFVNFARHLGSIFKLGVGLVVVTSILAGLVGAWVVPGLTLGAAVVLGATVAPPDAVSALAIGRELGLRKRVLSLLTGESLVNDAAALTMFSVAVASVAGTHNLIDNAVLLFLYSAVVGILVGVALAQLSMWVRRRLLSPGLETVLGLIVPFAAYLLAEQLEASGVIAVVAAGFVVGTSSAGFGYETRLQERQVWGALDVLLEAFVFAYVGLQLRFVLEDLTDAGGSVGTTLGAGAAILAVVVLARPLYMLLLIGPTLVVRDVPEDPEVQRAAQRWERVNQREIARGKRPAPALELLTWREGVVVAWTGMRGVVTLAAAAGVPTTVADGSPFPGRPEIQVIAFVVAVGTLLLQGATLPWLIRRLDVQDPRDAEQETVDRKAVGDAAHAASRAVFERFAAEPPDGVDPEMVERFAGRALRARDAAVEAADTERRSAAGAAMAGLMRDVIGAQREAVVRGRDAGELDDDAVRDFLEQVDYQEAAVEARMSRRL